MLDGLGQAGAAVVEGAFGLIGQGIQNSQNKKLARYQYELNQQGWEKQNLYNNPSAQMERLKAAGLNPNLIYGNGTAATGNASPPPEYQKPEFKLDTKIPAIGMLAQTQNIKLTKAQTDNVNQDVINKRVDNVNKIMTSAILKKQAEKLGIDIERLRQQMPIETETMQTDLEQKKRINPYQADTARLQAESSEIGLQKAMQDLMRGSADIENVQTRTQGERLQNRLRELEAEGKGTTNLIAKQELIYRTFQADLAKHNINSSDNIIVRQLAKLLDDEGVNLDSAQGKSTARRVIENFLKTMDQKDLNELKNNSK